VGSRASLKAKARGKILCLCRGSNPGRPVRGQILTELPRLLKLINILFNHILKLIRAGPSYPVSRSCTYTNMPWRFKNVIKIYQVYGG
jgi:hypothetical protein